MTEIITSKLPGIIAPGDVNQFIFNGHKLHAHKPIFKGDLYYAASTGKNIVRYVCKPQLPERYCITDVGYNKKQDTFSCVMCVQKERDVDSQKIVDFLWCPVCGGEYIAIQVSMFLNIGKNDEIEFPAQYYVSDNIRQYLYGSSGPVRCKHCIYTGPVMEFYHKPV